MILAHEELPLLLERLKEAAALDQAEVFTQCEEQIHRLSKHLLPEVPYVIGAICTNLGAGIRWRHCNICKTPFLVYPQHPETYVCHLDGIKLANWRIKAEEKKKRLCSVKGCMEWVLREDQTTRCHFHRMDSCSGVVNPRRDRIDNYIYRDGSRNMEVGG